MRIATPTTYQEKPFGSPKSPQVPREGSYINATSTNSQVSSSLVSPEKSFFSPAAGLYEQKSPQIQQIKEERFIEGSYFPSTSKKKIKKG
jgi:hypothetical protein